MKLKNNENLDIELKETGFNMTTIEVDGFWYAQFQRADIKDIDLDKLSKWIVWIEGTYCSKNYKSASYVPCDLNLEDFKKD